MSLLRKMNLQFRGSHMIQINLELAERIGITNANLSILKTGKAKAVRLTTLDAICRELGCQPGDILEYIPDEE